MFTKMLYKVFIVVLNEDVNFKKNNFMAPIYGWGSIASGYRATTGRQFTFYH